MVPHLHLEEDTSEECSLFEALNKSYRSAVSSLSYLSEVTQPDIFLVVSFLCQCLENPGIQHWNFFLHDLRYLKGNLSLGLFMYQMELVASAHNQMPIRGTSGKHSALSLASSSRLSIAR
ncbi:hypothetical protein O181_071140 [Austropuccinia psidii MF-1]|uniref:Uncharacterized protein n=1 Tax=Austropuccinia psidii MF-1 TaxID=1389203 RepID=A0A9Q3F662_9BASI|nr:hypothetical protein [Austropuccinia psidii MF-1]